MRQITSLLVLLGVGSAAMVLGLYWNARPDEDKKNGFVRVFKNPITFLYSTTLDHANYYFAGWDDSTCYLGTLANPAVLVALNFKSKQEKRLALSDHGIRRGKVTILSPHFYLADLELFDVYRGDIRSWNISILNHADEFFTEIEPTLSGSLIFRTFNEDRSEFVLAKATARKKMERNSELLEKQIDGLFCVDGMLRIDPVTQRVVYTYFYRNEFVCADTSLRLLYRANTIDTIRHAKIKVASGKETLASPPFTVNRKSVSADGVLYINSNLKADNEAFDSFRGADVIDRYRLGDGQYQDSFYIPKVDNKRLRHFGVYGSRLYVLHENLLQVYALRQDTNPG